jgi:hypothetical protein
MLPSEPLDCEALVGAGQPAIRFWGQSFRARWSIDQCCCKRVDRLLWRADLFSLQFKKHNTPWGINRVVKSKNMGRMKNEMAMAKMSLKCG